MYYADLAVLYVALEKTTKKLEKAFLIAQFLKACPREDLTRVVYLLQGRVFPSQSPLKLGMSSKLLVKVIVVASGESTSVVEEKWKMLGDLGLVAEKVLSGKKQKTLVRTRLTVAKVAENIAKLSGLTGEGAVQRKVLLIAELLSSATPIEARYIVRTVAESLRTGVGDGVLRDAITWAFYPPVIGVFSFCPSCHTFTPLVGRCLACGRAFEFKFQEERKKGLPKDVIVPENEKEAREIHTRFLEEVQHAFNLSTDFGKIAETLKDHGPKGLGKVELVVGKPVNVMLYPRAQGISEGFEVVGRPAMIEPKIDGFRVQVHKKKDDVWLFTRRLENVTAQFPDVVRLVKTHVLSRDVILDTEVVGVDPQKKRVVPFQHISQRIKRKYDIEKMVKELPVFVNVFDIIELNGETLLDVPFSERRKKLKAVIKNEKQKIEVIDQIVTSDEKEAEKFYRECLAKGHEGVMMKSMHGVYKPGKRVGQGVKVKPVMESLDVVIIGAEWGEGKRARWLSSYTIACRDGQELKVLGKVSTGLKEKSEEGASFEELTKELKNLIVQEKGRAVVVKPAVVVEVIFEEIQESPSYTSGFALRFPRIFRVRYDKGVRDISTLREVKELYRQQR